MVINFSQLDLSGEPPVMILKNQSGVEIGAIGQAFNKELDVQYNEVSTLTFDVPAYVNGEPVQCYKDLVGLKDIDVRGIGQFVLMNPEIENDGVAEVKHCKAYSLEYELTRKKMSVEKSTYNFYSTVAPESTVIGIALSYLPSWSVGEIDADLYGKYRTFEISDTNVFDFLKTTVQEAYGCVITFDTYQRKINARSVYGPGASVEPVFVSLENLAKKITIEEQTEDIFTSLDVNGADGVNIRAVNPMGTNKIYNLDYFMNTSEFPQSIVTKWGNWNATYEAAKTTYFDLAVRRILRTSAILTEQNVLTELKEVELGTLEVQQSVWAQTLATFKYGTEGYTQALAQLTAVNTQIEEKKTEIAAQEEKISALESEKDSTTEQMQAIIASCSFSNFFTDEEMLIVDRYFIEDSISESSFVAPEVGSYTDSGTIENIFEDYFEWYGGTAEKTAVSENVVVYTYTGGAVRQYSTNTFTGLVGRANIEYHTDTGDFIATAYVNSGNFRQKGYNKGCASITFTGQTGASTEISDNCDEEGYGTTVRITTHSNAHGGYILHTYTYPTREDFPETGSSDTLYLAIDTGFAYLWYGGEYVIAPIAAKLYFTTDVTEYERYSVESELYDYGEECLRKLAYPAYTFSVDAANFFALEDFVSFAKNIKIGEKIYLDLDNGVILNPICVGLKLSLDDTSSIGIEFSNRYSSNDSSFSLVDLLDESVSMGHTVDTGRYNYSAFIDSGASTSVKSFMESALDVAKNAVIGGENQEISWTPAGFKARKWDSGSGYDDEQLAIINNSIVFTDDGWATAKMGIGKFNDTNAGEVWGVVAPNIVGTIIAGSNLIIESQKTTGTGGNVTSVFKVDADGAVLNNSTFRLTDFANNEILLDPELGIGIGEYPLVTEDGGERAWDESKAKFWVDQDGDLHLKGILEAASGNFQGVVKATDFQLPSGSSFVTALDSNNRIKNSFLDLGNIKLDGTTGTIKLTGNNNSGGITIDGSNGTVTFESGSGITEWTSSDIANIADTQISAAFIASPKIYGGQYRGLGSVTASNTWIQVGSSDGSLWGLTLRRSLADGTGPYAENAGIFAIMPFYGSGGTMSLAFMQNNSSGYPVNIMNIYDDCDTILFYPTVRFSSGNYGSTLPGSGDLGQVFFKI